VQAFAGLIDVLWRSRFTIAVVIATLAACGGTPREASRPNAPEQPAPGPGKLTTDPDLNRPPPTTLLSIDWKTAKVDTDADALALWSRIAPTAEDWEARLDEIPDEGPIASALALALLHGGNFTCVPPAAVPARDCAPVQLDVPPPSASATFDDPCLRRMLAMWAIGSLDDADLPAAHDALRAIAAIPPPESQLVATALGVYPESDHAHRLELRAIAFAAGHRELVNGALSDLDDAHVVKAVVDHHIDGGLDLLSAESHRAVFVAAVADEALAGPARAQAMIELVTAVRADGGKLPADVHRSLVTATRSKDCTVAAAAARILVGRGEKKFAPSRPRNKQVAPMMRALCVLASYEAQQQADEASYLLGYVPAKGLEVVTVTFDPYNEVDADGDGDPHTVRTTTLVPRGEVLLPEIEDLVRALRNCAGATCRSADREYKIGWKPGPGGDLLLARLEVGERPPCPTSP
jgi:hypothetical protein